MLNNEERAIRDKLNIIINKADIWILPLPFCFAQAQHLVVGVQYEM